MHDSVHQYPDEGEDENDNVAAANSSEAQVEVEVKPRPREEEQAIQRDSDHITFVSSDGQEVTLGKWHCISAR
jgi:hypothetical protein